MEAIARLVLIPLNEIFFFFLRVFRCCSCYHFKSIPNPKRGFQ